jgi:gas vesicle protein
MIGFIIGFFVGGFVGVMGMSLFAISKDSEQRAEQMRKKEGLE